MTLNRPALMVSALALLGCNGGADGEEPPRPRPRLWMVPGDLTSAVGAAPLQVVVDNYSDAVRSALLAPIAAEIRLVSWPEGAPVPIATQLQEFETRRENGFQVFGMGKITVLPAGPLEDRWYFLHLVRPSDAVEAAGVMQLHKLGDGRVGVRFTPGADPRMTWIRRCPAGVTPGKVAVDFSERVLVDSAEALTVEASGPCSRPSSSNDGAGIGKSFSFGCDGLTSNSSVRVFVASTVTGVGGRAVRGAGLPSEFPAAAFAPGGGCSVAAVNQE